MSLSRIEALELKLALPLSAVRPCPWARSFAISGPQAKPTKIPSPGGPSPGMCAEQKVYGVADNRLPWVGHTPARHWMKIPPWSGASSNCHADGFPGDAE